MFDKCITCERLGQDCVPNLMALPFPELLSWWKKRQAYLGWSNQILAEKSNIPLGTINRIKAGEEDCRYSTMRSILHALMGGYAVEFPCQKKLDMEFAHIKMLEDQNAELTSRNDELAVKQGAIDEVHRNDIRIIKAEYQEELASFKEEITFLKEEITFLKEQLRTWQHMHP